MLRHSESPLPPLTLQTPRMLLRPWRLEDRQEVCRVSMLSAEFWRPWMPEAVPGETAEQLFDRLLHVAQRGLLDGTQFRMVAELDDRSIAGFFSLTEIVHGSFQNAYAGWRVRADLAGQGYGTEGVQGLLDLALLAQPSGLGLHRVQANIIPTNLPSQRVAEKCGMRREGYALRYLKIAGRWQDHLMFAKTADEHLPFHLGSSPRAP